MFYKPLLMLTAYKRMGFDMGDYPNAYAQYENEISLPLHTGLSDDDVEYICENLMNAVSSLRKRMASCAGGVSMLLKNGTTCRKT